MPAVFVETEFLFGPIDYEFCDEIGDPNGSIYPIRLWGWASQSKLVDGACKLTPKMLAQICRWTGDADILWSSMTSHFLRQLKDGRWYIRGWRDHQGEYMYRLESDRNRKRQKREEAMKAKKLESLSDGIPADILRTSCGHPADIQKTSGGIPNVSGSGSGSGSGSDPDQEMTRDQKKPTLVQVLTHADGSESGNAQNLGGLSPQTPRTVAEATARASDAADPSKKPAKKTTQETSERRQAILDVFAHYREKHPRSHPRPSSALKEWRLIASRLDEGYSADDLKEAIDGQHRSKFHLGENDRSKQYLSLELAMRDSKHVADFIETLHTPLDIAVEVKKQFDLAAMDVIMHKAFAEEDALHASV